MCLFPKYMPYIFRSGHWLRWAKALSLLVKEACPHHRLYTGPRTQTCFLSADFSFPFLTAKPYIHMFLCHPEKCSSSFSLTSVPTTETPILNCLEEKQQQQQTHVYSFSPPYFHNLRYI